MVEEELIRACLAQLTAMSVDFDEDPNGEYYGNVYQSKFDKSFEVYVILEWDGCPANWVKTASFEVSPSLQVEKCILLELDDEGEVNEKRIF